jgi:hypothetical protein
MSHETYEVLVNSCFGRFSFPPEVVAKVFVRFPPDSVIGRRLFPPCRDLHILTPAETPDPSWDKYYVIQSVEPLTGDFQMISANMYVRFGSGYHKFVECAPFFVSRDMATYYSLRDFNAYDWRTNSEILRLSRGIIGKEYDGALLRVERVPIHCGFHIVNDDGNEELVIDFPV